MTEPFDPIEGRATGWPWREMELMLEHMFSFPTTHVRPTWRPAVDVLENEDEFIIVVDVPGLDAEQVEVALQGRVLTLRGARPTPESGRGAVWHVSERPRGHFERRIHLPLHVNPQQVEAKCRNGILTLRVRKARP